MANPQLEHGHTKIANELVDAIIRLHLGPVASQCLWLIIRKTYGWTKKWDTIAISQFVEATKRSDRGVERGINELKERNVIFAKSRGLGKVTAYSLNKDHEKWVYSIPSNPRQNCPPDRTVAKPPTELSQTPDRTVGHKRHYTKDNTKDIYRPRFEV